MNEKIRIYHGGKTQRRASEDAIKSETQFHLEQKNGAWDVYDSFLEEPTWQRVIAALLNDDDDMIGPPPRTFQYSFQRVLPRFIFTRSLKHYVESSLSGRKGDAIGIELGGTGSHLFQGFSKGLFRQTIGVNLKDSRTQKQIDKDNLNHHEVIERDLLDPNTIVDVSQKLNGKKADLIIERMQRGFQELSDNPYVLTQRFGEWYQLLNDEGIFLAQVPPVLAPVMTAWVKKVREQTNGSLDIIFANYNDDYTVMRLIKHKGSPDNIPVLSPRELRSAYIAAQK